MLARKIFILLLILLALMTLFLQLNSHKTLLVLKNDSSYPDAYVENVNALQMNADGLPDSRLQATVILHYTQLNSSDLTMPIVTLYKTGEKPWQVTAKNGRAVNNAEVIYLWNHVRAHQPGSAENPETTLLTSEATLFRSEKVAVSNKPVTLIRPGLQVQSVGARANMNTSEITLFSKAQASYDQQKSN